MIQGKAEELHDASRSDAFLRIHLLLNPKKFGFDWHTYFKMNFRITQNFELKKCQGNSILCLISTENVKRRSNTAPSLFALNMT